MPKNGTIIYTNANWNNDQSRCILSVNNDIITWNKEPTVQGHYKDGAIHWSTGQIWRRTGLLNNISHIIRRVK